MNPRDFPLPKAGEAWPNFLSETFIRPFVQRVNALSNVTIVRGNADNAVLSDGNLVLTIAEDADGAPTSVLYIRVCLRDGSEKYIPFVVAGTAVDFADIPSGASIYDPE